MILSSFLSRQKHDESNPHEIIPVSFNMQSILQTRYYILYKGSFGKYLVQTRSQEKSCGIKLPEVQAVGKVLDLNIQPEKQVMKPIAVAKAKELSHIEPRLSQGRAGLRCKIKMPVPQLISRPVVQEMENPVEQSKVLVPESSRICDKITPDYAIPHISSGYD